MKSKTILIIFALLLMMRTASAKEQSIQLDQTLLQTVAIADQQLIKFFVDDFMIPEDDVQKLVFYDISGDGFGLYDIARTYPGGKIYLLTPSAKAQTIMNKWSFGGNIKFTANFNDPPEIFENAPDSVRAMGGIFAALLNGMRRNYKGVPIKIHLEQNNNVATIEMWGFNPGLMRYQAPPVNQVPKEIPVMKLIYLEKSIIDSVFTKNEQ